MKQFNFEMNKEKWSHAMSSQTNLNYTLVTRDYIRSITKQYANEYVSGIGCESYMSDMWNL